MIILAVYCTMSLLCLWIEVTVISQAPGFSSKLYDLNTIFPLAFGYSQILNISVHAGALFSIIPPFASALGYVFVAGRQMHSMATSGLLPPIFRITYGDHYTPIVSMITIAVISAAALIAAWHVNPHTMLFRMAILGGCVVYISMFFCFSIFKMRFGNMPRQFINPLGHFSSIFGIIIFSVMLISLIVFQPVFEVIVTYAIYMLCAIFYYYFVAETRQFFSEDEQRLFLKAYIVNGKTTPCLSLSLPLVDCVLYACCQQIDDEGKLLGLDYCAMYRDFCQHVSIP